MHPGRPPYRLYALSNLGSLLALLSYPFLVEPSVRLRSQTSYWSWGYVVFAALCAGCALTLYRSVRESGVSVARGDAASHASEAPDRDDRPGLGLEERSKIDRPIVSTVFCFLRPHRTWIETVHCGKSAYTMNRLPE